MKKIIIEEIEKYEVYDVYKENDEYRYKVDFLNEEITTLKYDNSTGTWYGLETRQLTNEEYNFYDKLTWL